MTPEESEEIKRLLGVYHEDLRSEIRLLGDGVALNTERFDRVDQRFDRVDQRFDRVDQRFDKVDQRLDGIDQRLDGLRQEMRQEFTELRSMIKLSYAEIDRRLANLETGHQTLTDRVSRLEAKLAS